MRLEITTVVDVDWMPQIGLEAVLIEHERTLQEAATRVGASGVAVRCSTTVQRDRPLHGLLAAAQRADLLVIGSHKSSTAVGIINGTLPLAVAARTRSPLVVVPVGWQHKEGPVIVGVDDETGTAAMAFAAAEADRLQTTLVAVRAWKLPPAAYGAWPPDSSPYDDVKRAEGALLETMVSPVRARHEHLPIDSLLEDGRPSVVLAQRASSAQLAVVGSHGRGAVAGLLLGSVGHDLLMNMPSPVAIVPRTARSEAEGVPEPAARPGARTLRIELQTASLAVTLFGLGAGTQQWQFVGTVDGHPAFRSPTFAAPYTWGGIPLGKTVAPREEWAPGMTEALDELALEIERAGWTELSRGERPWDITFERS
ncbi:hypothetical protein GCM10009640_08080 [Agrococcus citreus]|uniref:UspA domain-containing protein n=2 Tax=Agrococcus citreus TaxID=84643 RepID=A0ABP4JHK3_9MICO